MTNSRIIKRYANRKLYDTQDSQYVTLERVSEMIKDGDDVVIIDNKSKEDLTSVTLAQIIFEEEKKRNSFLSLQAMKNIIQSRGESITQWVNQAQRKVQDILPRREGEDEKNIAEPDALESEVDPTLTEQKPAYLELKDWIMNSQKAIEDWQHKVDHRIRNVVEGITPFAGLHKDMKVLSERVAELEVKLKLLNSGAETNSSDEDLTEEESLKKSDCS